MLIHASLDPHYRNWPDMRPTYLRIPTFPGIDFSSAPHICEVLLKEKYQRNFLKCLSMLHKVLSETLKMHEVVLL